jgi:hypothetical protein
MQRAEAATPAPGPAVLLELTSAEVKQLWFFLDGSVQELEVRRRLRRGWGFCPRHTWCLAVTEAVFRSDLRATAILYEDLLVNAATALARPAFRPSRILRRLRPGEPCLTCDYVAIASPDPLYAGRLARVNRRERFTQLLVDASPIWLERSCPACIGGSGLLCRPHLLAQRDRPPRSLPPDLRMLAVRLADYRKSTRWQGRPATLAERASWVEALGWFAGWHYAARSLSLATCTTKANRP